MDEIVCVLNTASDFWRLLSLMHFAAASFAWYIVIKHNILQFLLPPSRPLITFSHQNQDPPRR